MDLEKKIRVLAVDDLPDNLKVLGSILIKNGYETSLATNGKQAIELAKKFSPDVILLDIMMPEMDGYQTCTLLKQDATLKHIPVIFLTAKTEMDATLKGFEVGALDYLTKPFNSIELLSRVNVHASLKIARDLLLAQKAELERLDNIKTKLFTIIGHDLKSPLNAIYGLIDLIMYDVISEHDIKNCFMDLKNNVNNTSELLNNLLSWSSSQISGSSIAIVNLDMKEFIENCIKKLQIYAEPKKVSLTAKDFTNFQFKSDENALKMVLRNLVKNAIKFTPSGGKIEIIVNQNIENKTVDFCVKDSGIGMSNEVIDKILNTGFYTTNGTNGEKGTGLGLLLCRDYIDKLKGNFSIESEIGKGSSMKFSLPLDA